ncbi:hypothetical protein [Nocardia pseudobrasiliensis]|uniref:hypothetical protein n=1 Tax=Nocardia pseudobrasiliensis TaxID=45979 RepID=UPI0012E9100D|nr:hypothetical protein [Nocardia pseudobrasiliensis]
MSTTSNVRALRDSVVALSSSADALDESDPQQRAVRRLYDYLEATTLDALAEGAASQHPERIEIENALASVLAASRRGGSVYALSCVRDDLEQLTVRIDELKPDDREPLRSLLSYVDAKNRQALELAIRRDWGTSTMVRRLDGARDDRPDGLGEQKPSIAR